ncbi:MAG: hypothetical protein KGI54_09245 [Pseudomonadota bacterium]|nr:hypothetical protein [Pseudomonadota bacterium]
MNLTLDSYCWNKAIPSLFKKGIAMHQSGLQIESCPYGDKRKPGGRLPWSRPFIVAWCDGWRWSANGKT